MFRSFHTYFGHADCTDKRSESTRTCRPSELPFLRSGRSVSDHSSSVGGPTRRPDRRHRLRRSTTSRRAAGTRVVRLGSRRHLGCVSQVGSDGCSRTHWSTGYARPNGHETVLRVGICEYLYFILYLYNIIYITYYIIYYNLTGQVMTFVDLFLFLFSPIRSRCHTNCHVFYESIL
jgi:hypothetical protein